MTASSLVFLIAVFFVTGVVGVVTGSASLITVPVMISVGIEPHAAIATNMLALIFMSLGGALSFMGKSIVSRRRLTASILLTVGGSALGALLLLNIPVNALQITIAIAMMAVAVFSLLDKNMGMTPREGPPSRMAEVAGFGSTFLLAVYGGFFGGGYVTVLTIVFVSLFGMTFVQAVATTKLINIFSSGIATAVFLSRGLVDLKLGLILGPAMFLGALLGGRIALLLSAKWLRRIFIGAVFALAARLLIVGA